MMSSEAQGLFWFGWFFGPHHAACRILVPQPGKLGILTTGQPENCCLPRVFYLAVLLSSAHGYNSQGHLLIQRSKVATGVPTITSAFQAEGKMKQRGQN